MLKEVAKHLRILCDNKVSEQAIINVLNSKLAHLFSFKKIKYISYNNLKTAYPISYYGLNFVPSGGVKNQLINEIDNNLLPFLRDEYERLNRENKEKIEQDHFCSVTSMQSKSELKKKESELEKALKEIRELKYELPTSTPAAVYASAEVIDNSDRGSLFLKQTEFADFFDTAMNNCISTNKLLLDLLFDLYDGQLNSTDTLSKSRKNMYNIPFSVMLMSDFSLILNNEKLNKSFKSFLQRGFARRSFVYINKEENYFKERLKYPTKVEKQCALIELDKYRKILSDTFNAIRANSVYYFADDADDIIRQWKISCDNKIAQFYENIEFLDDDNKILEVDLMGSAWKITKLAFIYHVLTEPSQHIIKKESVVQAITFYEQSYGCLCELIFKKPKNDIDKLFNFLSNNLNKWVKKIDIRKEAFVDNRFFANWFKENVEYIVELADFKGYKFIARAYGTRNNGVEYCIYDPKVYKFNSSIQKEGDIEKGDLVPIHVEVKEFGIDEL